MDHFLFTDRYHVLPGVYSSAYTPFPRLRSSGYDVGLPHSVSPFNMPLILHDLRNLGILGTLDDSDITISSSFSMPTSRVTTSCNDFLCIPDTPFPSQLLYYMSRLLYAPPFLAAHDCTVVRHHSPVSWEALPQVICHAHFLEHRPHHLHI